MIALATILISAPGGMQAPPANPSGGDAGARNLSPPRTGGRTTFDKCRAARKALRWYVGWTGHWREQMGAGVPRTEALQAGRINHLPGRCPQYLAKLWRGKAIATRQWFKRWAERHTLRAPDDWPQAVHEAQRAYPGTGDWLLSCSASEGGWGRWVPNSQGAPPGGWLQFYESTFWRMWSAAHADIKARDYRVPRSAHSWYSPLGQALAGAWGLTHGRRHEWSGSGC